MTEYSYPKNFQKYLKTVESVIKDPVFFKKLVKYLHLYPLENWRQWTDLKGNGINISEKLHINKKTYPVYKNVPDLYIDSGTYHIVKVSKKLDIKFNDLDFYLGPDNKIRVFQNRQNFNIFNLKIEEIKQILGQIN